MLCVLLFRSLLEIISYTCFTYLLNLILIPLKEEKPFKLKKNEKFVIAAQGDVCNIKSSLNWWKKVFLNSYPESLHLIYFLNFKLELVVWFSVYLCLISMIFFRNVKHKTWNEIIFDVKILQHQESDETKFTRNVSFKSFNNFHNNLDILLKIFSGIIWAAE